MVRPLDELQRLAIRAFAETPKEVRPAILDMARDLHTSPSGVVTAMRNRLMVVDQTQQTRIEQAVRWLVMIRRDYKVEAMEETIRSFWYLASGEAVVDRPNSHLHANVARLLRELLVHIHAQGRRSIVYSHDFKRVVGTTICVATDHTSEIVHAQRVGRHGLTRFVKGVSPQPTAWVTIILLLQDGGRYEVRTAYTGPLAEPEPWDHNARQRMGQSRSFWARHALVWGSEPIIPGTETLECPW